MNATIARLAEGMNSHDAAALTELFAPHYRSEQPVHPNRGFGGRDQVEANWTQMFAGVPDMTVECLADIDDGATVWSEWVWRGTHTDGSPFEMRGVTLFGITDDGLIESARLYMEPVERDGAGIEDAVQELARPSS